MKKIILLCALSIVFLLNADAQNKSITFRETGSFSEVLAEAAKSKKLIFLDAYTSWCVPCKVLAKEVFTVDSIADFFNANFINVHYDMEKGEGLALKKRYESDISAYPTLLFINGNGEIVHKIVGGPSAKQFMELSRPALNPELSLKGLAQKFENGDRSISTVKAYFKSLGNSNDMVKSQAAATAYFDGLSTSELKKADVWTFMTQYLFNIESKTFVYVLAHRPELMKIHGEAKLNAYLLSALGREVGGLSMAYYSKKAADTEKEAWLLKTLNSINSPEAEEMKWKVQMISSRNKGDWDAFHKLMTEMIVKKSIKEVEAKTALMLNFTRKFVNAAPADHLEDALSWADLLLKSELKPNYAIDLLSFKKMVLTKQGKMDQLQAIDEQIELQKKIKAELMAKGIALPGAVRGFM
jgi:thiol-disulfide isomerase/thioredoxin